jgi:malonate decarboxylase delta subunit
MNQAVPPGLELLEFQLEAAAGHRPAGLFAPVLVGVVASGNLEVLLEAAAQPGCAVRIETSARGFAPVWRAVLQDFQQRLGLSGLRLSLHDMGATPAVVSLRLDQAAAELP